MVLLRGGNPKLLGSARRQVGVHQHTSLEECRCQLNFSPKCGTTWLHHSPILGVPADPGRGAPIGPDAIPGIDVRALASRHLWPTLLEYRCLLDFELHEENVRHTGVGEMLGILSMRLAFLLTQEFDFVRRELEEGRFFVEWGLLMEHWSWKQWFELDFSRVLFPLLLLLGDVLLAAGGGTAGGNEEHQGASVGGEQGAGNVEEGRGDNAAEDNGPAVATANASSTAKSPLVITEFPPFPCVGCQQHPPFPTSLDSTTSPRPHPPPPLHLHLLLHPQLSSGTAPPTVPTSPPPPPHLLPTTNTPQQTPTRADPPHRNWKFIQTKWAIISSPPTPAPPGRTNTI